jgi:hypothetical protein
LGRIPYDAELLRKLRLREKMLSFLLIWAEGKLLNSFV